MTTSNDQKQTPLHPHIQSISEEYLSYLMAQGKAANTLVALRSDMNIILSAIGVDNLASLDEKRLVLLINNVMQAATTQKAVTCHHDTPLCRVALTVRH